MPIPCFIRIVEWASDVHAPTILPTTMPMYVPIA